MFEKIIFCLSGTIQVLEIPEWEKTVHMELMELYSWWDGNGDKILSICLISLSIYVVMLNIKNKTKAEGEKSQGGCS